MIAEFNWWLLLLGLVVGGGLTWLVLTETRRREQDLEEDELPDEAAWLEERLAEEGQPLPAETIERVLRLHRAYLAIAPPEDAPDDWSIDEFAGEREDARPESGGGAPGDPSTPDGQPSGGGRGASG